MTDEKTAKTPPQIQITTNLPQPQQAKATTRQLINKDTVHERQLNRSQPQEFAI